MPEQAGHSVVAVDISPTHLKFVEFFPFENRVAAVAVEALQPARWGNDAYLEEQIRTAMERHVKAENTDVITSVFAGHTILRTVEIPDDEENFLKALRWDMGQYLARPLDEYLMDYQSLGHNQAGDGRLYLVAAYRRSEVERLRRVWENAGFTPAILDVDAFAAVNAFEANYPGQQTEPTFLIKADSHAVLCIRAQNGMFLSFDAISVDANSQPNLADLAEQVSASFDASQLASGKIRQIFLCGDLALNEKFRELLEEALRARVTLLDAFREMQFIEGAEMGDAFSCAPQCAAALGLALRRAGDC